MSDYISYKMELLRDFNRAIRKSPYYEGRSIFKKGGATGNFLMPSSLELPFKDKFLNGPIDEVRIVNFQYLATKRCWCLNEGMFNRWILFEGGFGFKDIVNGKNLLSEVGCFECSPEVFKSNAQQLGVLAMMKGQLHLVKFKNRDTYCVRAIALF